MTTTRGPHSGPLLRSYKVTQAFVRRIVAEIPPTKETVFADQDLPRHYIRVRPPIQPGRPWPAESRVRYTLPGGHRRWLTVGNPRTMTLPQLREAARAALAVADAGGDPAAERAARNAAWTVKQLWSAYFASPEFARCTAEVRRAVAARFALHILPRLGNERLAHIEVPMVRRLMRAIDTDTRTNARGYKLGGPSSARKTARLLSATLSWAVGEGQLKRNPLHGALRLAGERSRETVITQPLQYITLFETMDRMVAAKQLRPSVRVFLICAALTGMRRGELQALIWQQIDLSARRITLADTKGAKLARGGLKRETISIPPLAAAALAEILPADASPEDQVFPPFRGRVLQVNVDWRRVRAAAGLPADLALHGLRHSLGTAAVLSGLSGPEVQALLRHRSAAVSARYIHLAEIASNRLQDRVAERLIGDATPSAEIHTLSSRRR
jgi:integrase